MKDFLASIASLLVIVGAVSIAPDSWFLEKIEKITSTANSNAVAVAYITEEVDEHLSRHNEDAIVIASSINDARLLTEEYFQRLSIQIEINSLEAQIAELIGNISREQSEIDRLDRIINGNSSTPASEETFRARRRSQQYIESYDAQMDAAVRELNRLMSQPVPGL